MSDDRLLPTTCDWSQGWGGFFILMIGWSSWLLVDAVKYFCITSAMDCDGSRSRAIKRVSADAESLAL